MAIVYDASSKTFNLSTSKTSYVLKVLDCSPCLLGEKNKG